MCLNILDQLVKEWIQHEVLGYALVCPKDGEEGSENHLCGYLVDLSITLLVVVAVDEAKDDGLVHLGRLFVLLLRESI